MSTLVTRGNDGEDNWKVMLRFRVLGGVWGGRGGVFQLIKPYKAQLGWITSKPRIANTG